MNLKKANNNINNSLLHNSYASYVIACRCGSHIKAQLCCHIITPFVSCSSRLNTNEGSPLWTYTNKLHTTIQSHQLPYPQKCLWFLRPLFAVPLNCFIDPQACQLKNFSHFTAFSPFHFPSPQLLYALSFSCLYFIRVILFCLPIVGFLYYFVCPMDGFPQLCPCPWGHPPTHSTFDRVLCSYKLLLDFC